MVATRAELTATGPQSRRLGPRSLQLAKSGILERSGLNTPERVDAATFERTALAFDNPDFVEIVIHSYRHRFGLVAGDPAVAAIERSLATRPPITVPTITLDGADDGVMGIGETAGDARHFTGRHEHRVIAGVGHNLPQEAPAAFADAMLTVAGWS